MKPFLIMIVVATLTACTSVPPDPEIVARQCEDRARAAQGPTGSVTLGTNSRSGPFARTEITLSSDFLAGRDPMAVYEQCVYQRTGQPPIWRPELR